MRRFSFVGVTTGRSAIMRVFPEWARHLGLGEVAMVGYDLPLHAEQRCYREVVEALRSGREEAGGLVTTHKIDLFDACRDMFDYVDPWAELCGEVSSLSKRDGLFRCARQGPDIVGTLSRRVRGERVLGVFGRGSPVVRRGRFQPCDNAPPADGAPTRGPPGPRHRGQP